MDLGTLADEGAARAAAGAAQARRRGATIWFTGLPGAGKTSLSTSVERALLERGHQAYRLDGDEIRRDLCQDLGFDRAGRAENVRRVALVARLLADAGVLVLVALVSPYATDRRNARELHRERGLPFVEVFLDTPATVCEQRDPKGMYARARRGELHGFTGVDDPYERPAAPDVRVAQCPLDASVSTVLEALAAAAII